MGIAPAAEKSFDVELRWDIQPERLSWPSHQELEDPEATLGGNHHYQDLRGATWDEVSAMAKLEGRLMARIESAPCPSDESVAVLDELETATEGDEYPLLGLDLGVAAAVLAISAAGQIPVLSCNGGAFGGAHRGEHPYVAFHAQPEAIAQIMACARAVGAGLSDRDGLAVVYGRTIGVLRTFALEMFKSSGLEIRSRMKYGE